MPRKYKSPLNDLMVKAKDCYDPRDYVMVHKDYLARLQALEQAQAPSDRPFAALRGSLRGEETDAEFDAAVQAQFPAQKPQEKE